MKTTNTLARFAAQSGCMAKQSPAKLVTGRGSQVATTTRLTDLGIGMTATICVGSLSLLTPEGIMKLIRNAILGLALFGSLPASAAVIDLRAASCKDFLALGKDDLAYTLAFLDGY